MGNMRFKVGDRVKIKSLDWYNKNKDKDGNIVFSSKVPHFSWNVNVRTMFTKDMVKFCGKVVTIETVWTVNYSIVEGTNIYYFTDEMIEGLVEETKFGTASNPIEPKSNANSITQSEVDVIEKAKNYWDSTKDAWICPDGYQFVDENGNVINATKIVLEKKKKEYPKTYEECAEIIAELTGSDCNPKGCMGYMSVQLTALQKLLTCRDAYWKIAGEEIGLGKPWEPNWGKGACYTICCNTNQIVIGTDKFRNSILTFPTEEMRDAFYENFKEEIEICKELL